MALALSPDTGTISETYAENLISTANDNSMIEDGPDTSTPWQFNQFPEVAGNGPDDPGYTAPLEPDDATRAKAAVAKSNEAFAATSDVVISGDPAPTNNPPQNSDVKATVASVLGDIDIVGKIGDDISDIVGGGGKAKLHWWGWEAQLDDKATKALVDLLAVEDTKLVAVLAAFSSLIPAIAAVAGIFGVVSGAFAGIVKSADEGKGVTLRGYLWLGLSAHSM